MSQYYSTAEHLEIGQQALIREWGAFDFEGEDHLFDITDYYEPEMGTPLYRRLVAFETLMMPTELVDMKLRCNQIENETASEGSGSSILIPAIWITTRSYWLPPKARDRKSILTKGSMPIWSDAMKKVVTNLSTGPFRTSRPGAMIRNYCRFDRSICNR